MNQTSTELALLENALVAIEKVLAHGGGELQGTPYLGPTANMPLEAVHADLLPSDAQGVRSGAAHSALSICLSSAAALVEVAAALMNRDDQHSEQEIESEWHALITHTKIASRSSYRAALIMAAQMNLRQGRGVAPVAAALQAGPAASLAY